MRAKAEAKEANGGVEERKSVKVESQSVPIEEDNKAWCLTQQLKSRMDALHGGGKKKAVVQLRKRNYKATNGLSDEDTTPSEFDPDDS